MMATQTPVTDEIFPQHSHKSYALVELMRGEGPLVGKGPDDTIFSFPVVLLLEVVLLLGVTLAIFLFSLLKQAPLETIANPLVTTDPAKAPWYFVGLQELLEHMHPLLAGIIIPSVLVAFLVALPYLDHARANAGVWFSSVRGRRIVGWTALYTAIVMPAYIVLDNAFSLREMLRHSAPQWVAQGLLPAAIIAVLVALPALILWSRKANIRELMLALFTIMFVSAIIFTLSGFLFRGPGFKMYWPWQMPNGYNPWDGL
jgi:quinol---cytochrome c reductase cytochrome c subunit, bacillus type